MNPNLKTLLDLWGQIVAGAHKRCDHVWNFCGEYNCVSESIEWYLIHDGYCHSNLYFGPFDSYFSLSKWDGHDLCQKMLTICREELLRSEEEGLHADMPVEHWKQLIEKLENL